MTTETEKLTPVEAIEACREVINNSDTSWSWRFEQINNTLDRVAIPEPVEPLDWPDKPGVWECELEDEREVVLAVDLSDGNFYVRTINGELFGRAHVGRPTKFVPCEVTPYPVKEPEPKPERPPMLLAKHCGTWLWWMWYAAHGCWRSKVHEKFLLNFEAVDREASDPEAVKLWDEQQEASA